jgi:hypothetical protein
MTLAQIVENPITVATDDAISNLADSRQGLLVTSFRRPNRIVRSRVFLDAPGIVASALNGDSDRLMS